MTNQLTGRLAQRSNSQLPKRGEKQRLQRFARLVAGGRDLADAAKAVDPSVPLSYFTEHSDIMEVLHVALVNELASAVVPKALNKLKLLIDSKDERVALAASKAILDKAIATPKPRDELPGGQSDLERLSQAELADMIHKLEGELSDRAKDVTPHNAQPAVLVDAKALNMFD